MIYLDNNASTRVFPCVTQAMLPFFTDRFANPGSGWGHHDRLDQAMRDATRRLGAALGDATPERWVVTSGATEANNLAVLGAARARPARRHVVISALEHPSVAQPADYLRQNGYLVSVLPVDEQGRVDPATVAGALRADTLLVSVMLANNEIGVVAPIAEIAARVKAVDPSILVHTDATQAIGKVPIDLGGPCRNVDLLSFSAHKFHGPKSVGALFVRDRPTVAPLFFGGGQQQGLRPGTESPAQAIGMAVALTEVVRRSQEYGRIEQLRDRLEREIMSAIPGSRAMAARASRIPNTSFLTLNGVSGTQLAAELLSRDIAIATGSACHHGAHGTTGAAAALGLSELEARGAVRISLSLETTDSEIESLIAAVRENVERARAGSRQHAIA